MVKFYAVKQGIKTGIYTSWEECKLNVIGYSGAIYKSFDTFKQAEEYINQENTIYYVVIKGIKKGIYTSWNDCKRNTYGYNESEFKSFKSLKEAEKFYFDNTKTENSLYVDGGHNKDTGSVAYGSVVDHQGNDMIEYYKFLFEDYDLEFRTVDLPVGRRTVVISNFEDCKLQQNNGAELLALFIGLKIANHITIFKTIFSDSQVVCDYWSKNIVNNNFCDEKIFYIKSTILQRNIFEKKGGTVIKITGNDNLADLGYHK